jgi:hypothetical protein
MNTRLQRRASNLTFASPHPNTLFLYSLHPSSSSSSTLALCPLLSTHSAISANTNAFPSLTGLSSKKLTIIIIQPPPLLYNTSMLHVVL